MSICGPLFGAVVDVLQAAATAGSIGSGTVKVDPARVYQAAMPQANLQRPSLCIALPTAPYDSSDWGATQNIRNGIFKVQVGLVADVSQDAGVAHPYGDGTNPGILTLADDVANALENGKAAFYAATARLVDYSVSSAAFAKEDALVASATITITFKTRFQAGAR